MIDQRLFRCNSYYICKRLFRYKSVTAWRHHKWSDWQMISVLVVRRNSVTGVMPVML